MVAAYYGTDRRLWQHLFDRTIHAGPVDTDMATTIRAARLRQRANSAFPFLTASGAASG
jgi:hypothetical protein